MRRASPMCFRAAVILLIIAAPLLGDDKPPLIVTAQRGQVQARLEKGEAIIDVKSSGGIGSATLRWADPKPMSVQQVKIRLRYSEHKPFVALEGFSIRLGKLAFQTSLGVAPQVEVVSSEQGEPPPRLEKPPQMPITKTEAGIEISLPAEVVKGVDEFTIQWVDYYRG